MTSGKYERREKKLFLKIFFFIVIIIIFYYYFYLFKNLFFIYLKLIRYNLKSIQIKEIIMIVNYLLKKKKLGETNKNRN